MPYFDFKRTVTNLETVSVEADTLEDAWKIIDVGVYGETDESPIDSGTWEVDE